MLKFIAFMFVLASAVQAQNDKCPTSPIIFDFDATKYLGRWFEIKVFPNFFQPDLSCVSATYGLGGENNVTVFNEGITTDNKLTTIEGSARAPDANKPNQLLVILKVEIYPNVFLPTSGKYDVWDTDYNTYALVYSCVSNQSSETAWILSRTRTLSQTVIDQLESVLKARGVDPTKFRSTNQSNCPN